MRYLYEDQLYSDRLFTRFLRPEDMETWEPFFENKLCTQFLSNFPDLSPMEKAKHMIDKQIERYDQKRYGLQMISNRIDNKPIGLCGLLLQQVDDVVELEVGYHFLYQHWGFGYATEAASIMIEYARKNKLSDSVISIIDLLNYKSQAVAERNGFVREKELLYFGDEVYIYRRSLL